MKIQTILLFAVICSFMLTEVSTAQGFKDIIQKIEAVESKLNVLEKKQTETVSNVNGKLAKFETSIKESESNTPVAVNLNELNTRIDGIDDDLGVVVSETFRIVSEIEKLKQTGTLPSENSVQILSESLDQMKLELANLKTETADVETAVDVAVEDATAYSLSASFDPAFVSQYVWRGIALNKETVIQPSLTLACNNLSLNVWSSMDMTDINGYKNDVNELDFTLDYSSSFSLINYSAGVVRYTFPETDFVSTTELYLVLSSEKTGNMWVSLFQDVAAVEGSYVSIGNGTSLQLGTFPGIDVSGSLNWGSSKHNNFYYGYDNGAMTDCNVSISSTFGIGSYLSVTPSITFASLINEKIRDSFKSGDIERDNVIGGLTLSAAF